MKGKYQRLGVFSAIVIAGMVLTGILVYQVYFVQPTYVTVKIKGSPGNWWWVTPRPPDWLAESVDVGDKEYNAMNRATAEILNVTVYDAGGPTKDVYLTAKLEVRHNKRTNKYRYKGEPLEIGGPISLSLTKTFFPGMVVAIYDDMAVEKQYVEKSVKVRHNGRWPYEYDSIVIGDTIKDGQGIVIAEITEKYREPALREGMTSNGQFTKTVSPIYQDFYITLKLQVEQKGEELVFREEQYVKVSNELWLMFPRYNMSGVDVIEVR